MTTTRYFKVLNADCTPAHGGKGRWKARDTWYGGSEYDGSACVLDEVTLVRGADI